MRTTLLGLGLLLLAGCGGGDTGNKPAANRADTLTQRQHDSILANSSIPGAGAVGKAMRVADSTSAQVQAADSVGP